MAAASATAILRTAVILALLSGPCHAVGSFAEYMAEYGRNYAVGSEEYVRRRALFDRQVAEISAQNAKPDGLWEAGLNDLTDRTEAELAQYRGWRRTPGSSKGSVSLLTIGAHVINDVDGEAGLPATMDWSKLPAIAKAPNQGSCGSCWAIATSSLLRSHFYLATNTTRSFSAQELVNCVPNPRACGGTGGCDGATMELALEQVMKAGLSDDAEVPYRARTQKCKKGLKQSGSFRGTSTALIAQGEGATVGLQSWVTLPSNTAAPLMRALLSGPVGVSADASKWGSYSKGVFDNCPRDSVINHAILMIGYGSQQTKAGSKNYWAIQNSWGANYGENGVIKLLRHDTAKDDDAHCGVDHAPADGTACKPYPKSVTVCGMCGVLYDSVTLQMVQPVQA